MNKKLKEHGTKNTFVHALNTYKFAVNHKEQSDSMLNVLSFNFQG
jgi:hypothetical protein